MSRQRRRLLTSQSSRRLRSQRRQEIRDRIAYLTRQAEELIAEKRQRIEERLWAIHEADVADYFETYQAIERDHNHVDAEEVVYGHAKRTREPTETAAQRQSSNTGRRVDPGRQREPKRLGLLIHVTESSTRSDRCGLALRIHPHRLHRAQIDVLKFSALASGWIDCNFEDSENSHR